MSRSSDDYSHEDDLLAVQQTLHGEHAAFDRIVERYTPVLYRLAMRYLNSPDTAEDAVQEIFLRAYRALGRFQLSRRFYSWIYSIAVNYLKNARSKHRRRGDEANLPYDDAIDVGGQRTPLAEPERELEQREARAMVREAISNLPDKYRDVIILYQFEELPIAQVAEILGIPEGTVKTHLHRARHALATALSGVET